MSARHVRKLERVATDLRHEGQQFGLSETLLNVRAAASDGTNLMRTLTLRARVLVVSLWANAMVPLHRETVNVMQPAALARIASTPYDEYDDGLASVHSIIRGAVATRRRGHDIVQSIAVHVRQEQGRLAESAGA